MLLLKACLTISVKKYIITLFNNPISIQHLNVKKKKCLRVIIKLHVSLNSILFVFEIWKM